MSRGGYKKCAIFKGKRSHLASCINTCRPMIDRHFSKSHGKRLCMPDLGILRTCATEPGTTISYKGSCMGNTLVRPYLTLQRSPLESGKSHVASEGARPSKNARVVQGVEDVFDT